MAGLPTFFWLNTSTGNCECGDVSFRIYNGNGALDNSWDISINGTYVCNYSGDPQADNTWPLETDTLVWGGTNYVNGTRVSCVADDLFDMAVHRSTCADPAGIALASGQSGLMNKSYFDNNQTCTDDSFQWTFDLPSR